MASTDTMLAVAGGKDPEVWKTRYHPRRGGSHLRGKGGQANFVEGPLEDAR